MNMPIITSAGCPPKPVGMPTCQGCRLSKVKCDLQAHGESGVCSRCTRLGLVCAANPPARRGRHGDSVKRMSTALLAMRRVSTTFPRRVADPATAHITGGCFELHRSAMLEADAHAAKMLFVKTYFAIARRTNNWVLTSDALKMAHQLQLPLHEAMKALTLGNEHGGRLADPGALRVPEFIGCWRDGPLPCLTRVDDAGVVRYEPNAAMVTAWTALGVNAASMAADLSDGAREDERLLVEDYWLSRFAAPEDVGALVLAWARAYARIGWGAGSAQEEVDRPLRMCITGHQVTCRPRIRILVAHGGREIWEATVVEPVVVSSQVLDAALDGSHATSSAGMTSDQATDRADAATVRHDSGIGILTDGMSEEELSRLAATVPLDDLIAFCAPEADEVSV